MPDGLIAVIQKGEKIMTILLNELYENKIEYSIFAQKYKASLNDDNFYVSYLHNFSKLVAKLF